MYLVPENESFVFRNRLKSDSKANLDASQNKLHHWHSVSLKIPAPFPKHPTIKKQKFVPEKLTIDQLVTKYDKSYETRRYGRAIHSHTTNSDCNAIKKLITKSRLFSGIV
jgi:hypothetical protein